MINYEKQNRWCGHCGESVVPIILPAVKELPFSGLWSGKRQTDNPKQRLVCPDCHHDVRQEAKKGERRLLKQSVYAVSP